MVAHSAAYFAVRLVNGVLALTATSVLTRLLDAEQYGVYALGMAAVSASAAILFQWLNAAVARFHAAFGPATDELVTEAHRLFLGTTAVALLGAVCVAVARPFDGISPTMTLIITGAAVLLGLQELHLQISNARGQALRYGFITMSRGAASLLLAIALIQVGIGPAGPLVAVGAASVLAVGLFGARWKWRVSQKAADLRCQLLSYGAPIALTAVVTMILGVSDRFLVGFWHGTSAVAGYAAAYDLAQQSVGVVLSVFMMASYPRITAAWEAGGTPAAADAMEPLARALFLSAPLIVGAFVGLAPEIARILLGAGLRHDAAVGMPWIAFAIGAGCFKTYLFDIALNLSKSTGTLFAIASAMAVSNVALNLLLIPRLGLLGAAISSVVAFTGGALLSWWKGHRVGVYPPLLRELVKAGTALLGMVAVMRWIGPGVPFGSVIDDLIGAILKLGVGLGVFCAIAWLSDLSLVRTRLHGAWRESFD